MYAHVAFPIPVRRTFAYRIPGDLAEDCRPGSLVEAPFGAGARSGVVLEVSDRIEVEAASLKPLTRVLAPGTRLAPHALELARWMADYYLAPIGEALAAQLPGGPSGAGRKRRGGEPVPVESDLPRALPRPFALTSAQARAVSAIGAAVEAPRFAVFLLHGITGSGKTQVYLEAAERARALGGQTLLLVPEVALAYGLVGAVRRVFGERVAVLHSYLRYAERRRAWEDARRGRVDVIVGARSAVFAPLPALRLVVVDEEHEPAYKQSEQLRYHGRDVAVWRARQLGVPCVLGSATPSLESWQNARTGKYERLSLPERVDRRPLPTVETVDLGAEPGPGTGGGNGGAPTGGNPAAGARRRPPALLTPRLAGLVEASLARDEQVLLFLNRRGHSRVVECERCGHAATCPQCELGLTYHSARERFLCHYCDHAEPARPDCPACGSPILRYRGSGTQRIERELARLFPETPVYRLDSDSARRRGRSETILDAFARGEPGILLGTQLVAKGHDFPGVTLVGVLNADTALHLPDFRAAERTFQLLTQVAGRAGRGRRPGHVLLQTRHPEHPALVAAATQDYEAFARAELETRRRAGYPPSTRLVSLLVSGPREDRVIEAAARIGAWGEAAARTRPLAVAAIASGPAPGAETVASVAAASVEVLGPAPQSLVKLRGRYRWHVTLRSRERRELHRVAATIVERLEHEKLPAGVRMTPDVDPVELL